MMFHSDQPINKKELDCLNRSEFSRQLAKAIISYTKKDNFVISLCGKWGSGKTSILNMVIEEIEILSNEENEEEKPIIIKFNPWNYADCSQLISQFFITIQEQLNIDKRKRDIESVVEALEMYSSLLDYTTYIPLIGTYLAPINKTVQKLGDMFKKNRGSGRSVEATKKRVIETLEKQKHKFIIIIDDIDRLNNNQIRAMFQLVNSLAGFPNMIYVLSFDREVVARALQEEQQCNGEEYLEKIIQVPFEVPKVNKGLVNRVFFDRISEIIFTNENAEKNFNKNYWGHIFRDCISPFVESIRDINRIVNVFEFKYGVMREEVNVIDLLALTVLEVCAPEIFKWIYYNSDELTGSVESAGEIAGEEQKDNFNKYLETINVIYPENPQCMMAVIQTLFPKFSWRTGGYVYETESNSDLAYGDRIASRDRFQRYFNLSLEENSVTKKQLQCTLYEYDEKQLIDYLMGLLAKGKLEDYLQELYTHIRDIAIERREIFIDTLTEILTKDAVCESGSKWLFGLSQSCYRTIQELFKQGKSHDNAEVLKRLINDAEGKKVSIVCNIIEKLNKGIREENKKFSLRFIEDTSLDEIEDMILTKIKKQSEQENFFDSREKRAVYNIWRMLDKESMDVYIKNQLQYPVNVPKYLASRVRIWNSGSGWSFDENEYSEYISKDDAYRKICDLKNTTEFSSLKENDKKIAIAFYLWCSQEEQEESYITEEDVDAIVTTWEYK